MSAYAYAQWEYSHYDIYPDQMFDCEAVDSLTFWAVGSFGYVIKSTDSGRSWSPFSYAHLTDNLYEVDFPDAKHGFAASQYGVTVIASSDSGNTWFISCQDLLLNRISGLEFADSLNGYISGANTIYRTTDAGQNWVAPDSLPTNLNISDFWLIDKDTVIACGATDTDPYHPMIIKTIDGGRFWAIISTLGDTLDAWIRAMDFSDRQHGWITVQPRHSYDNYLYATMDGGYSWILIWTAHEGNDSAILKKICALDSLNLKIISDVGNIRSSSDGGYNWNVEFRGYTGLMQAISMYVSTHGLVVGGPIWDNTPLILHYDAAVGIDESADQLPISFKVADPYPNPFNSSCLWESSEILDHVAIFDVTGKLIRKIVPDAFIISWDGRDESDHDVSSGVYFSLFRKGGAITVKKVVKLK
jgi:photosystem II stability/assembly factor-like uncharacterized protein